GLSGPAGADRLKFQDVDFEVRRGDLTAYLDITNVLNRANPCCTEYSLDEDGQLAVRTAHWLPLVPSLGIVWTF
ncbi:MAG: hypothetical protein P8X98_12375, partial [Woeseiaceae bacterium]